MGQKVHPEAMRVGYIHDWRSNWFSEKNFSEYLDEDIKVREHIVRKMEALRAQPKDGDLGKAAEALKQLEKDIKPKAKPEARPEAGPAPARIRAPRPALLPRETGRGTARQCGGGRVPT